MYIMLVTYLYFVLFIIIIFFNQTEKLTMIDCGPEKQTQGFRGDGDEGMG